MTYSIVARDLESGEMGVATQLTALMAGMKALMEEGRA